MSELLPFIGNYIVYQSKPHTLRFVSLKLQMLRVKTTNKNTCLSLSKIPVWH